MHRNVKRMRMHIMCASTVPGQQIHNDVSQEAFEDSGYLVRSVTGQSCYRSYRYPYTLVCLMRMVQVI